jgi:hypothetical protein
LVEYPDVLGLNQLDLLELLLVELPEVLGLAVLADFVATDELVLLLDDVLGLLLLDRLPVDLVAAKVI